MKYFKHLLKRLLCNKSLPKFESSELSQPSWFYICLYNPVFLPSKLDSICPVKIIYLLYNLEKKKPNQIPLLEFSLFYVLPQTAVHGAPLLFLHLCNHGLTEESPGVGSQFSSHQQLFPQNFSHCQVCCSLWINPH